MEVEITSKQLIKPSSPTPDHLHHYQLSFLDQIQIPVCIPIILFYSKKTNISNSERCNLLKKSLSRVLTIYYPLAGRIKNNSHIDCNDEGVLFVEAKANCELSFILQDRNPRNNNNLIPFQLDQANDLIGFVQITFFECGGYAFSFSMSHKLGDALSEFMVLSSWAAIARGNTNIDVPSFGWTSLFPPRNVSWYDPMKWISKEKIVSKMFVFDASAIKALTAKYSRNAGGRVSPVQALAAFIWSRFMAATQTNEEAKKKLHRVIHAVNLRPRIEPKLQGMLFGNLAWSAGAEADMEAKDDDETYGIVKRMKNSIRNLNADSVNKFKSSDEHFKFLKELAEDLDKEEVIFFNFSSICNYPTYEVDFGWGKPSWIGTIVLLSENRVFLIDTKDGQGIVATVNLKEEDMAKFEIDSQLLAYVSSLTPNGSPLHVQSRL